MKIVVLDGAIANPGDLSWKPFEEFGEVTVYPTTAKEDVARTIGDAELVINNKVPIDAAALAACPNLRYIGLLSTGYNVIDIEAAKKQGVLVSNVPGYSTAGVAQHTIALLLEICNHVGYHSGEVHAGKWTLTGEWSFWDKPLVELLDKTIGIVGFGSIGRAVGTVAKALGMRVLAAGSRPTPEGEAIGQYVPLEQLLQEADVVSLHCPLLPATAGMINKDSIAKMKDGAILLNTARGGLIVEQDLADALASGKVSAAGMDVVSAEPICADNPLLHAPNCYITPHIAWAAYETRERLLKLVYGNMKAFMDGKPTNIVNL